MFLKNNDTDTNAVPISLEQANEKININNVKISLHGSPKFGKTNCKTIFSGMKFFQKWMSSEEQA